MDVREVIQNVFGDEYKKNDLQDLSKSYDSELDMKCIEDLNSWLKLFLRQEGTAAYIPPPDVRDGRLGPALVRFDTTAHSGLFMISPDRLNVQSQSNFASIKANVCVFSGKWQFEVQLGTKGVMQVGWCTSKCRFSQDAGVGDTINSYAFDGNRIRKWNVSTSKYGQAWLSGDIIGSCIDLNKGTVHFMRNGVSMGLAFDSLILGPGISFFPAVSLAYNDNLCANFGGTPLRYPEQDYQPLQAPPHAEIVKANLLLKYLIKLVTLSEQKEMQSGKGSNTQVNALSKDAIYLKICSVIMDNLGPLLIDSYIVAECLIPCLSATCKLEFTQLGHNEIKRMHLKNNGGRSNYRNGKNKNLNSSVNRKLLAILDTFWSFCEDYEMGKCIDNMFQSLLCSYKQVSKNLKFEQQKSSLTLLCEILKHEQTRKFMLMNLLFRKVGFANFMHLKPVDEPNLSDVVPDAWWPSATPDPERDRNRKSYMDAVQRIREATSNLEEMQVEMLMLMLDNADGTKTEPSSRKIFTIRFRRYVHDHLLNSKSIAAQFPPPVSLCTFHRLLTALTRVWTREEESEPKKKRTEPHIPCRIFFDGSIEYYGIDRLGGVLSHIRKVFRAELVEALGSEHPILTATENVVQDPDLDDMSESDIMDAALGLFLAGPSGQPMANSDTPVFPALARAMNQPSAQLLLSRLAHNTGSRGPGSPVGPGPIDARASRYEILDGIIMYYHALAHRQLTKIGDLRDHQAELSAALKDTRDRQQFVHREMNASKVKQNAGNEKNNTNATAESEANKKNGKADNTRLPGEVLAVLQESERVFIKRLEELSRQLAWTRSLTTSPVRRRDICLTTSIVLAALQDAAANKGQLFAFVPDFYVEALCQLTSAVRDLCHASQPKAKDLEEYVPLLEGVASWLCMYFSDPRVVLAGSKDSLVQGLGSLAMCPTSLRAMERVPVECRMSMVRSLLRPYENRAWAQSNWLLVRFWQGRGFAFREARAPEGFLAPVPRPNPTMSDTGLLHRYCEPCPSEVFQGHVGELLKQEPLATSFINSVLNQLNWAFSEFIGMLQEIQNISLRPERVYIESRQLKICATCFELTVSLLRVVEMVTHVAPQVFLDATLPASDLLLSRLLQLICQILNRVSSASGCFQHAVGLSLPDLGVVGHFSILSAAVGVLLGLLNGEILVKDSAMPQVPRVCRALLTEPSFQMSSLKFTLGLVPLPPNVPPPVETFSFSNFPNSVSVSELTQLHKVLDFLEEYQNLLSASTILGDDVACPICYARPLSASFSPCGHMSCAACIAHHLMNSRKCFFCMARIDKVYDLQGAVLHVLPAS